MVTNPFLILSGSVSVSLMQWYLVLMVAFVVLGTLFDVWHKGSARYFFAAGEKSASRGKRRVGGGEKVGLAVKTAASEVLTSSEFCNPHRRIAHLLGMYGFVIYVISTLVMVFSLGDGGGSSGLWSFLWWVGALMVCVGGYWFWFFIRVDVAAEGNPVLRVVKADLFILSLVSSCTFGLLWAFFQGVGGGFLAWLFLALYLIATTVLFAGVPWSKFSHMFFKPAAAFQKKVSVANGDLDNLPEPADRTNPADRDRHSMELLKDAPLDMGLGIKREQPQHY